MATLLELSEAIGLQGALALSDHFGGCRVYVPLPGALCPDHRLVQVVGQAAAIKLSKAYGKEVIDVPSASAHKRAERNRLIRLAYDGAEPVSALARRFGLTRRTIFSIVAETARQ